MFILAHSMGSTLALWYAYSCKYFIDVIARRNSKVNELADIRVRVLILQGGMDRNVYPQVSEEFFKLLHTKDKEIKVFDCGHWFYDAIFYSQAAEYAEDRMKFISSIASWLGKANLAVSEIYDRYY